MPNEIIKNNSEIIRKADNYLNHLKDLLLEKFEQVLIPYRKKNKWGFCTSDKKIAIDCIYDCAEPFFDGLARVKLNGKCGFINKNNIQIVACIYKDCPLDFSEDLAIVGLNGKYGFINKKGELIVPCIYDNADNFSEGLALVELNGKYGFINKKGELIVPCIYDSEKYFCYGCNRFYNGLVTMQLKGERFIIDSKGKQATKEAILAKADLIRVKMQNVKKLKDEFREIELNGKYGLIDKNGKLIISCIYDKVWYFTDGYVGVLNEKWGVLNKMGEQIIPCIYDKVVCFDKEGLAHVKLNDEYGYINTEGVQYWED